MTGFIGATADGVLTTLGRGGSDYSASIVGAALDADEVWIWTDVDGVMTANPSEVPDARTLPEISYSEASELAYYGAKVLHYKTILPAFRQRIPVRILNSFNPTHPGTRVSVEGDPSAPGVKAVTSIRGVSLIAISGTGMQGIPGIVAKAFDVVAEQQSNVLMISQASSENNICFVISAAEAPRVVQGAARGARDRADARPHRGDRRTAGRGRRGDRRSHARHAGHRRHRVRRARRRADQRHRHLAGLVRAEHLAGRGRVGRRRRPFARCIGVSPRARPARRVQSADSDRCSHARSRRPHRRRRSVGLATAIAAKQQGLDYVIVEKGVLVNSIFNFPMHMVFFTTPELLEIGGLPLVTPYDKPTRLEALRYYRRVVDTYDLPDLVSRDGRRDRARATTACSP